MKNLRNMSSDIFKEGVDSSSWGDIPVEAHVQYGVVKETSWRVERTTLRLRVMFEVEDLVKQGQ